MTVPIVAPIIVLLRRALLVALVAAAAPAGAAALADRSPFAQGHWWDPSRSGSGFDIFNAGGQVGLVWFTYDASGRPMWYTAGGTLASMGTQSWPLLKHRWSGGRKAAPTVVGSLRLTLRNPEQADVTWSIGAQQGIWNIQPLIGSGVINEVDHSGHWFDPANSGWGFSLVEQGDVLGGALFTYDAAGEPTWVAGFARGSSNVEYLAFNGACPWCGYREPTSASAGHLAFDFGGESSLVVRSRLALAMAAGVKLDGASVVQLGRPASTRSADRRLARFDTDTALRAYLHAGMLNIPVDEGGMDFSAGSGSSATAYSPTNLQESGVDEADLVKTDGSRLYTFAHDSHGTRQPSIRVAQIGNEGGSLDVIGTVRLAGAATAMSHAGLFLHAGNLVSVTGDQPVSSMGTPWSSPYAWARGTTSIEIMDASGPALPVTRWRATLDGSVIGSRRIGQRLYVVTRFVPWLEGFAYGSMWPATVAANERLLNDAPLSALMPKVRIDGGAPAALLTPSMVYAPPQGARAPMADMIVVNAIDLDARRLVQSIGIVGTADAIYASPDHLFVATSRYASVYAVGPLVPPEPPVYLTDIHQIRIASDPMTLVGSGTVEGNLATNPDKASLRLSEHQGRLRVVTSSTTMWGASNQNRLTILEPSAQAPGLLKTLSYLPNARRPQTLGKPGELLYGTRFLGDRLYAVTFRMVDPLYVVDLADAADPRIAGALEVPGFSDYLHPLPNGLLLGFGKDAKPAIDFGEGAGAWFQGLQLSLFDVTDFARPREMQRIVLGKRGSESALLQHHHAFSELVRPDGTRSIAFPARIHDGTVPQYGSGDSAYYPWLSSGLARFELRGTTTADARLVSLPSLITHSAGQPLALHLDAAVTTARSAQFRNGTIYVANGQFWRMSTDGVVDGPR